MKISNDLPQFIGERTLLIVTSKESAEFYLARDGKIMLVDSFDLPTPRYSGREGFFARRGRRGGVSGAVREEDKIGRMKDFLRQLEKRTKKFLAKQEVAATYLYAPSYLMKQTKLELSQVIRQTHVMSFQGNYHNSHPFRLLEMISSRKSRRAERRRIVPTKDEAAKILRKRKS